MITQPLRELINRAKSDELGYAADYSPLESLIAPILDYGNHEAKSLIQWQTGDDDLSSQPGR